MTPKLEKYRELTSKLAELQAYESRLLGEMDDLWYSLTQEEVEEWDRQITEAARKAKDESRVI